MNDEFSEWTLVAEISNDFDLGALLSELDAQNISYRLHRTEPCVELWVEFSDQVPEALKILEKIQEKQEKLQQNNTSFLGNQVLGNMSFQQQLYRMPVIGILLALSLLGTALVEWALPLIHWFTFQDFILIGNIPRFDTAPNAMSNGEYWRLVTPIFLHFGLFHIAFNALWTWELGRRIEPFAGSFHTLVIVLLMAVSSNLGQYLWGGPSLFGGMSGVVYGLLGYVWIRHKVSPRPQLAIPPGLLGFMLFWLLLGMSGIIDLLMSGSIANAAHAVGLVTGMILGGWAGYSEPKAPAP